MNDNPSDTTIDNLDSAASDLPITANASGSSSESPPASEVDLQRSDSTVSPDVCSSHSSSSSSNAYAQQQQQSEPERDWDGLIAQYQAGMRPIPVDLPNVPEHCPSALVQHLRFVFGLRLAGGEGRPVPYGCEWAGQELGLHKVVVARWLRRLVAAGSIKHCGQMKTRDGNWVRLYRAP